ncbi:MAG: hypothetical protein R3B06_21320 [Kofleriaceae bacterium]
MSPSWDGAPRYFRATTTPGHEPWRPPGMIPAKNVSEVVDRAFQHDSVSTFGLTTARDTRPDSRGLKFIRHAQHSERFSLTYGERPMTGEGTQAWLEAVLTFFDQVGGSAGVVVALWTSDEVVSECGEATISNNGQVQHPYPKQLARMRGLNSEHMGTRYMRFPRWGTLVSHEHVAQLGGVGAISAAVAPAVVRELSGGVYFQLTDSLATARSEEFVTKRKLFTDFAAPLLPPPQPPR